MLVASPNGVQIEVLRILNGYEDIDRNMFFKLKEGSRTRNHKAALVKEHREQCISAGWILESSNFTEDVK